MSALLLRIRTWWETSDRTQRMVTLMGSVFLVLLLAGTFFFASRPKMQMLFTALAPDEQQKVVSALEAANIPVAFEASGAVSVPTDKLAEARMKLAAANALPQSRNHVWDASAEFSPMTPPKVEEQKLKALQEESLAASIETLDGVSSARVHLNKGLNSPFESERKPATASVLITEKSSMALTPEIGRTVAQLVANAVEGLDVGNVSVVNQQGRMLFSQQAEDAVGSLADTKRRSEIAEARRRERELQQLFNAALPDGAVVPLVNLELDFDKRSENETTVSPTDPISKTSVKEAMNGGGSPVGLAGSGTNLPNSSAPGTPSGTGGQGYKGDQDQIQYGTSTKTVAFTPSTGNLKKMSISVLVDQKRVPDPAAVQKILDTYLSPWAGQPEFVAQVTSMDFDRSEQEAMTKASAADAQRQQMQQILSILPIGALLLVGFMVMKAIGKAARASTVTMHALPDGTLALAGGEGGSSVGALSGGSESANALVSSFTAGDHGPEIEPIPEVINVPLEQIRIMSQERPEDVAILLKSWLLEERR